ncbi:earthbound 1 [Musca autumnalis]|uniref:earthbound 1 n=1 Tax=Musca autumnalis TaxID=221902 RepID=UPI003CF662EB
MKNSTNMNNSVNSSVTVTIAPNKVEKVVFDNRIKRKNVLALNEKVAAIREYEKRPIYKRIGRMFQCSPDQIKRIVQQKESILKAWEQRTRKSRDAKTLEMKVVRVSMLGKAVYEWIRRMMYYKDILITDGLIQKMALQFKSAMGLQNFFPHKEWCDKFRATYKIHTCDSKTLNIGYTQGHSVQIKDVMKDVLSECSPNEDGDEENEVMSNDDCISIDSDVDSETRAQKSRNSTQTNNKTIVLPTTSATAMKGMHQLVALPLQGNGMPGMGQKVLVATPIVPPGQKQGSVPMTMTIIPLASLGQSSLNNNNLSASNVVAALSNSAATCFNQSSNNRNSQQNNDDIAVPNPIIEIKQEIKEEPKDEEFLEEAAAKKEETPVTIKKECITDDEDEYSGSTQAAHKQPMVPNLPTLLPAHVVAIPLHNRDMMEDSSKDSLDDLTLSSLRKRIKTEKISEDEEQHENKDESNSNKQQQEKEIEAANRMPQPQSTCQAAAPPPTTRNRTPLPPLTKAPTFNDSSKSTSQTSVTTASSAKRKHSTEDYINDSQEELPAIRTCAEARKYLKLIEDFALERENFRLIGLITRADEVLRELDRKEANGGSQDNDDDVDID